MRVLEHARQDVRNVASEAIMLGQTVQSSEAVSKRRTAAIAWMERMGTLAQNGLIAQQFVTLHTVLRQPTLQTNCESRFFLRKHLQDCGWSAVEGANAASIEERAFNNGAPLEYFLLLQKYLDALGAYDDKYGFRHSQSKAYYEVLLACFAAKPGFDIEQQYVAPGQKADVYKALRDHFAGAAGHPVIRSSFRTVHLPRWLSWHVLALAPDLTHPN